MDEYGKKKNTIPGILAWQLFVTKSPLHFCSQSIGGPLEVQDGLVWIPTSRPFQVLSS